ncbi:MAG TPA: hypothetical protein VFV41_19015 [Streptosporangiaceae bacterium]|nr:hypothetical protein [Streptosporangiaceae bacterium]
MHGLAADAPPPVSSYVGYSLDAPWGQPRVVLGLCAEEAEQLAVLLDRHDCVGPVHASVTARPAGPASPAGEGSQDVTAAGQVPAGLLRVPPPAPASAGQQPLSASAGLTRPDTRPGSAPPRRRETGPNPLTSPSVPEYPNLETPIAAAASRAVEKTMATRGKAVNGSAAPRADRPGAPAGAERAAGSDDHPDPGPDPDPAPGHEPRAAAGQAASPAADAGPATAVTAAGMPPTVPAAVQPSFWAGGLARGSAIQAGAPGPESKAAPSGSAGPAGQDMPGQDRPAQARQGHDRQGHDRQGQDGPGQPGGAGAVLRPAGAGQPDDQRAAGRSPGQSGPGQGSSRQGAGGSGQAGSGQAGSGIVAFRPRSEPGAEPGRPHGGVSQPGASPADSGRATAGPGGGRTGTDGLSAGDSPAGGPPAGEQDSVRGGQADGDRQHGIGYRGPGHSGPWIGSPGLGAPGHGGSYPAAEHQQPAGPGGREPGSRGGTEVRHPAGDPSRPNRVMRSGSLSRLKRSGPTCEAAQPASGAQRPAPSAASPADGRPRVASPASADAATWASGELPGQAAVTDTAL